MKRIVIGKPEIQKENEMVKLISHISGDFVNKDLYFEVEEKYELLLCKERIDAFFVALIPYLLYRSEEQEKLLVCCEAPLSQKLFYQVTQLLFPALSHSIDYFHNIEIESELENSIYERFKKGAATGVSGGVDSFYTLEKSRKEYDKEYKVRYGFFGN
ncbi:MAG: hypothetical protein K6F35_09515 [Lachnospiraceae bacterium]|nr:hypothetical protein [Lachnospiraceae bacterium]